MVTIVLFSDPSKKWKTGYGVPSDISCHMGPGSFYV